MKKKRLTLHRETLRTLGNLRHVGGGTATVGLRCQDGETVGGECISAATCGTTGGGGASEPTMCNTCYPCSVSCFTQCLC